MSEQTTKPRLRFSLRSLLVLMLILSIALWLSPLAYDWYTSIPLADAVDQFNAVSKDHQVGKHEPDLTVDEVVAAIEAQLPGLADENRVVHRAFEQISRTRRLPRRARLHSSSSFSKGVGKRQVWWIELDVMLGDRWGYTLRIRKENHPKIAAGENDDLGPSRVWFPPIASQADKL